MLIEFSDIFQVQNIYASFSYQSIFQLVRVHFPEKVVLLEEEWGDSLFAEANYDAAINHFLGL